MKKKIFVITTEVLSLLTMYLLLISVNSCKKGQITVNDNPPTDKVFSGTFSDIYGKWSYFAIEYGFRKTYKAPEFDYLEFKQIGNYEIVKSGICVEKGIVKKDVTNSNDSVLFATFTPGIPFSQKYINPDYRIVLLQKDTLTILSQLDTTYSYRFVRTSKWLPKSAKGFHMNTGNVVIMEQSEIDYYDFSTNVIHFKTRQSQIRRIGGALVDVYVDSTFIYSLVIWPMISNSYCCAGANIMSWPSAYPYNEIFVDYTDVAGFTDKRHDVRIINALKQYGQYRE